MVLSTGCAGPGVDPWSLLAKEQVPSSGAELQLHVWTWQATSAGIESQRVQEAPDLQLALPGFQGASCLLESVMGKPAGSKKITLAPKEAVDMQEATLKGKEKPNECV